MNGGSRNGNSIKEKEPQRSMNTHQSIATHSHGSHALRSLAAAALIATALLAAPSCQRQHAHMAPAVEGRDSLPFLTAHGISNLISDSGVISYKIVAEDWYIYTQPQQDWVFPKGLFLEKFDTTFHVNFYLQSDTAYCHNNRIWELRGRVVVLNHDGDLFETEELFWDMDMHEMWNTVYMCITKPKTNQQLKGYHFRSNEQMTKYSINNSAGYTPMNDKKEDIEGSAATPEGSYQRPSQADYHRHN